MFHYLKSFIRISAIIALLLVRWDLLAQTNYGLGPFEISDQFPFSQYHLGPKPSSPQVIPEESFLIGSQFAWGNTATRRKGAYQVDTELENLKADFRYSPLKNLEIVIETSLQWQDGGILDHFIYEWHQVFGLPQGNRDDQTMENDNFSLQGTNEDNSEFAINKKGINLGDLVLGAKYLVSPGDQDNPAMAFSSYFRLPTATDYYQQDSLDLNLNFLLSKRYDLFIAYTGAGYTYFSDDFENNLNFYHSQFSSFISGEYQLFDYLSIIVGLSGATALVKNVKKFPEYQTYLDFGLKAKLSQRTVYQIAIRENPFPTKGTADVSFIIGLESQFD